MLKILKRGAAGPEAVAVNSGWIPPQDALWLDLLTPTREEELVVEEALGLALPTREEMSEIEPSSRLYQTHGATFMTATLLSKSDEGPKGVPVTFVLAKGMLVDIRYDDLRAFSIFAERAPGSDVGSGTAVLLNLLDAIIERLAEILEQTGASVEAASTDRKSVV